jgi:hypothetical protein
MPNPELDEFKDAVNDRIDLWSHFLVESPPVPPLDHLTKQAFLALSAYADLQGHCPACGRVEGSNIGSRVTHAEHCNPLRTRAEELLEKHHP